jgi:tripartite-type tricarboxylate transporter receptor subunit TctC
MTPSFKRIALALPAVFACGATPSFAAELPKDFPSRPVRLIVPFPPGGSNDILGRFMAVRLTEKLGQQVIVDNRPGADGMIGSDIAARSVPKDLAPIAMIGTGPNAISTNPGQPITNIKELIAAAKAKPGAINYASSGIGGFNHFGGELFKIAAGVDMTHVPYKGGGPAMIDLMAGHVPVLFSTLIQVLPHARSGKLRIIGTGGAKRSPALPNVPTVIEGGVPGYEVPIWWGFLGPAGLPQNLVAGLNEVVASILKEPETVKRLATEAAEPAFASPAEFGKTIRDDIGKWIKVARDAKMQAH